MSGVRRNGQSPPRRRMVTDRVRKVLKVTERIGRKKASYSSAICFLAIGKVHRLELKLPRDLVRLIATEVYDSNSDSLWELCWQKLQKKERIRKGTTSKRISNKQDEPRYEVEKIINHDSTRFCVKWVGFDDPTWEPCYIIRADAPECVAEYENK